MAQRQDEPLCRMCLANGQSVPATDADHIDDHNGDWLAFWHGELQSLCRSCHSRKTVLEKHGKKMPRLPVPDYVLEGRAARGMAAG